MKKIFLFISLITICFGVYSQNLEYYKEMIGELSSKKFEGRGYYKDGDRKAAEYIVNQFKAVGAKPLGDSWFQSFSFPVNVYHGNAKITVDGKNLAAGYDFVMREFSPGCKGDFPLYYLDTVNFNISKLVEELNLPKHRNVFVVIDVAFYFKHGKEMKQLFELPIGGIIKKWDTPLKFYKAYSSFTKAKPIVWVSSTFPTNAQQIILNVDSKMIENYSTNNVIAYIEGKSSDSFYVFTAHYDHLGHLGKKLYFPGANDNASGVAMMLTLAEYYAQPEHTPDYDMIFMAFAGEETGLRGSQFYTEHPIKPLEQIKYLINMDMVGDNSPDIYVEVSETGEKGLQTFEKINAENRLFTKLDRGELDGNSDHYPFAIKNVPAIFFIMETGDAFKIYHTPKDSFKNAYFDNYHKLFQLITTFIGQY